MTTIEFLRQKIKDFEALKEKAQYKEPVQRIIDIYKEELALKEPDNLKNWIK